MIPTSLLGEKGGYDCEYNISTAPLSITSKYSESSQQRFHSKQVDFNDQKAELATLKDEKKVQGDEYLTDVVLKNQIYTSLVQCASLNQNNSNADIYIFTTSAPYLLVLETSSAYPKSFTQYPARKLYVHHCLCPVYSLISCLWQCQDASWCGGLSGQKKTLRNFQCLRLSQIDSRIMN